MEEQKPIRWTVSLRKRDTDLQTVFKDIEEGDRSAFCRELMRDGMKLRQMQGISPSVTVPTAQILPLNTPTVRPRQTNKELLESKIDKL